MSNRIDNKIDATLVRENVLKMQAFSPEEQLPSATWANGAPSAVGQPS